MDSEKYGKIEDFYARITGRETWTMTIDGIERYIKILNVKNENTLGDESLSGLKAYVPRRLIRTWTKFPFFSEIFNKLCKVYSAKQTCKSVKLSCNIRDKWEFVIIY